jgi:hypothetical protein
VIFAKIAKDQRQPGPFRNAVARGPVIHVVAINGELIDANMKPLFFKDEVSATKIPKV